MSRSDAIYYYSQDGLGSVRTLSDLSGAAVNRYDYTAWGEIFAPGTRAAVAQRYAFTGRERNPAGPLMYYRYRQYKPSSGRFLSWDPMVSPDPTELCGAAFAAEDIYLLASNRPLQQVDPFGLSGLILNFVTPANTEWSNATIEGAYGAALIKELTAQCWCECTEECASKSLKYQLLCSVKLRSHIFIDRSKIERTGGATVAGTLGHEQRHVQKYNEKIKERVKQQAKGWGVGNCYTQTVCEEKASRAQKALEGSMWNGAVKAIGHAEQKGEGWPGEHKEYSLLPGTGKLESWEEDGEGAARAG